METKEDKARVLVEYLLEYRCRELNYCADIPVLEAAVHLCRTSGLENEATTFTNRLLDEGRRNSCTTKEVPSPLVMALSGFFGLKASKFADTRIRPNIKQLIRPVRAWHKLQLEAFNHLLHSHTVIHSYYFSERLRSRSYLISQIPIPEIGVLAEASGLPSSPIVINDPRASGLEVNSELSPEKALMELGGDFSVSVLDVALQESKPYSLGQFVAHFKLPPLERKEILNLISFNEWNRP